MPPKHLGRTPLEAVPLSSTANSLCSYPSPAPEVYATDICRLCQEARATLVQLLWNCQPPTSTTTMFPPQFEAAMRSEDYETQARATRLLNNALDQQRPARRPEGITHATAQDNTGQTPPVLGFDSAWDNHIPLTGRLSTGPSHWRP
ncbi:hypothetical protein HPB48_005610 [Haemaphysalis longicornis]|uniref:Uncharacterized protein n=1 Tax=Haemaphysalis longicornis TaxID=44386 RepID=A0A9J6GFZ0_HAELO|nr:hypothetical protein HPB48_005610 [Haemaphysalis longicornis]